MRCRLGHVACGILVPGPGIEFRAKAVKVLSPNHWTTRELQYTPWIHPFTCSSEQFLPKLTTAEQFWGRVPGQTWPGEGASYHLQCFLFMRIKVISVGAGLCEGGWETIEQSSLNLKKLQSIRCVYWNQAGTWFKRTSCVTWRRQWQATPVLLPRKSHGWRSLVGYSPPGWLQVGCNWATSLSLFTFTQWRGKWQPTPVFLPRESQGQQSLVGCCLWGRTESDMTKAT